MLFSIRYIASYSCCGCWWLISVVQFFASWIYLHTIDPSACCQPTIKPRRSRCRNCSCSSEEVCLHLMIFVCSCRERRHAFDAGRATVMNTALMQFLLSPLVQYVYWQLWLLRYSARNCTLALHPNRLILTL